MEVAFHVKDRDHVVPGSGNLFSREKRLLLPVPYVAKSTSRRKTARIVVFSTWFRPNGGTTPDADARSRDEGGLAGQIETVFDCHVCH